jgi:hypothetical protein
MKRAEKAFCSAKWNVNVEKIFAVLGLRGVQDLDEVAKRGLSPLGIVLEWIEMIGTRQKLLVNLSAHSPSPPRGD